jgi:hypothetical protein
MRRQGITAATLLVGLLGLLFRSVGNTASTGGINPS